MASAWARKAPGVALQTNASDEKRINRRVDCQRMARGEAKAFEVDPPVRRAVRGLPDWELAGRELTKGFYLKGFNDAIGFINDIAGIANEIQHHPDVLLSEFSTVRLFVKTNEFGKVTMRDVDFAKRVEGLWETKWRKREKTTW